MNDDSSTWCRIMGCLLDLDHPDGHLFEKPRIRQATLDVGLTAAKPEQCPDPCPGSLDFGDGTGALCVNLKLHRDGGCIWSRSAWNEAHGLPLPHD